jgi:hypothetical protein
VTAAPALSGPADRPPVAQPGVPPSSPFVIVLTAAEESVLTARAGSGRTEHRDRVRARIVLAAAAGVSNAAIAAELGLCVDTADAGADSSPPKGWRA